jgi:hypothetical protein
MPQSRASNGSGGVKMICHLPYLPYIAPAVLFLCWRMKTKPAGISMSQESIKTSFNGVVRTIAKEEAPLCHLAVDGPL